MGGILLICAYKFMAFDFMNVELLIYPDGRLDSSAMVSMQGQPAQKYTVSDAPIAEDEFTHLWLDQQNEGGIEMIVYKSEKPEGNSQVIHPNLPFGNRMWGHCDLIPQN